jgi:hypothetical protein
MTRAARAIMAMAAIVGLTGPARASNDMTAGDLFTLCADNAVDAQSACDAFLLAALAAGSVETRANFCVPAHLEIKSIRSGFMTTVVRLNSVDPSDKKMSASSMVAAMLNNDYPCPKQ